MFINFSDKLEKEKQISSLEKELGTLSIQNEQLSKKKVLRIRQLDDRQKYNKQEEQGNKNNRRRLGKFTTILLILLKNDVSSLLKRTG